MEVEYGYQDRIEDEGFRDGSIMEVKESPGAAMKSNGCGGKMGKGGGRTAKRIARVLTKPSYTLLRDPYKNVRHEARVRLRLLLHRLVKERNWEEASGVLSTLLKGTCRERTPHGNRLKYWGAMELLQQTQSDRAYSRQIKHIYDIWMKKIESRKRLSKDTYVQLEFIIFSLEQNNLEDAHQAAICIMQEPESENNPISNLILGLTFYQLWYSTLPEDMQLKELDTSCLSGMVDALDEPHIPEQAGWQSAVSIVDARDHLHNHSETSVMNDKTVSIDDGMNQEVPEMGGNNLPRERTDQQFQSQGLYMNAVDVSGQEDGFIPPNGAETCVPSVFSRRGLDSSLLPLRLPQADQDMEEFTSRYAGFFNNHYMDAMKYLQLAVNCMPPVQEALLPLIQLLLLGDQLEEAMIVLEKFCHSSDTALPFRLRTRLLEFFASNNHAELSISYEAVLKMDPTCSRSVKQLIKLYQMGVYTHDRLLEMVALHLDATYGDHNIWGELASCLLKLCQCEEDRMSFCLNGVGNHSEQRNTVCFSKIPIMFLEGSSGKSWKFRAKWWLNRHFSKAKLTSELTAGIFVLVYPALLFSFSSFAPSLSRSATAIELFLMHAGDYQLMACKAACASHFYGPRLEYVTGVCVPLEKEGKKSLFVFLQMHMKNSIGFYSDLSKRN